MTESATNTANMSQQTSTYNVELKPVSPQTGNPVTTVDMTTDKGTVVNTSVENKPQTTGFDTNNKHISPSYVQRYMPGINKQEVYIKNKEGDEYLLNKSLGNKDLLTLSFKNDFKTQINNRNALEQSKNLFATLDNKNYKYGRLFFQGNWINTRTPIDPDTGNEIGLPEMLTA